MSKPKLVLINPGQEKDRLGPRRRTRSSVPKLNLPLLAAYADDRFDVRIVDEVVEDIDFDDPVDLVGISLLPQLSQRGYEIAREFQQRGAKVVMGGFHVFFYPDEAEQHADAIVIGEADTVWNELLDDFLAGKMKKRYQAAEYHNLVGLPKPRRDLLKPGAYTFMNVVETSRGCPHRCAYCAVTKFWGHKYRFRPVAEVVDEVRSLPPGPVMFIDDNIIASPQRAKELFRALTPLKRRWFSQCDMRIARDPELLQLAAESGCRWLFMGIETLNAENLKEVGKSRVNKVEEITQSIAAIHDSGINVFGSFIFGFDHDDESVFDATVQFCEDNHIGGANFYIFTPFPFTDVFADLEKEGRILTREWWKYDANHVVFQPKLMTPEQLLQGYLKAYRSFYSIRSTMKRAEWFRPGVMERLALNLSRAFQYKRFAEGCGL